MGEVTKDTFDTIGNVGKLTEVYGIALSEQVAKETMQKEEPEEDEPKEMIEYDLEDSKDSDEWNPYFV